MITGYNHNVKYKGDIFHVQTEDSGRQKAHVITHLYFGGNIVVSRKAQYHDLLGGADEAVDQHIVDLMQQQHKDILRGLLKGTFDVLISERSQGASFLNGPAPLNVDGGCQHRSSFGGSDASTGGEAAADGSPATQQPSSPQNGPPSGESQAEEFDGTFALGESLLESLMKAAPVVMAEDLEAALDKGDDEALFGEDASGRRLDDVMLDFMRDL